jgi:hypothetical protein
MRNGTPGTIVEVIFPLKNIRNQPAKMSTSNA